MDWQKYVESRSKVVGKLLKEINSKKKLNHLVFENFIHQIREGNLDQDLDPAEKREILKYFDKIMELNL